MANSNTAQQILDKIYQYLCTMDVIDADLQDTILTITIEPTEQQYMIHYHSAMQQIWLASPLSGAHHFKEQDLKWLSTRDGADLLAVLSADLSQSLNKSIDLNIYETKE